MMCQNAKVACRAAAQPNTRTHPQTHTRIRLGLKNESHDLSTQQSCVGVWHLELSVGGCLLLVSGVNRF